MKRFVPLLVLMAATLGAGAMFGELAMFRGETRSATAEAVESMGDKTAARRRMSCRSVCDRARS